MKRRDFFRYSALTSLILPGTITGCTTRTQEKPGETSNEEPFALLEATIDDLRKKMEEGTYTARDITQMYLDRIAAIDKGGPKLNSVIEINPDALAIADELDRERAENKIRGPLHGIPILIKDNIDTGDNMMTTAGSLALDQYRAAQDAFVIQQLRATGAIILGKANLSEWANFRSTRSSSGWSSRGGQTRNPYVLERSPCGSSSGSGVAVAANLCAAAVGTETNGSIACPSSINGIVGIKPTVGLVSRSGIIPISHTQDTAGPMARTVRDAAILLGAMVGIDDRDPATRSDKRKEYRDYTPFLDANGLSGKRIGVEKSFLKRHEGVDALFHEAIETMKAKGAEMVEVDFLAQIRGISGDEFDVLRYEFKDGLNRYLATANAPVKSLKELIAFNEQHADRVMPYFRQEILEQSEAKGSLDSPEYRKALEKILSTTRKAIDGTLQEYRLAAICGPTNGPSWCIDLINGDSFTGYGMYSSGSIAGYPHITVPMGMVFGLPVGLTFLASAYQEPELLTIAYAYEQASQKRTVPQFLNTVPGT